MGMFGRGLVRRRYLLALGASGLRPVGGMAAPAVVEAWLAPAARLWPRWQAHDPHAARAVDHAPWDRFLRTWLFRRGDGVMGVAYGAVTREARDGLRADLARLAAEPVSRMNRTEQMAYWINVYNALTVQVVLDAYPVRSIRDIPLSPGLFATGPWGAKLLTVEDEALSLDDIEHRILRPIWRDPRIHYAVNCASVGCPDLRPAAFTGANADAMLDHGARDYINHRRGVDATADGVMLSSIYNWFAADFGGEAGVMEHLRRYAAPPLAATLAGSRGVAGYHYDWSLNDVALPRR